MLPYPLSSLHRLLLHSAHRRVVMLVVLAIPPAVASAPTSVATIVVAKPVPPGLAVLAVLDPAPHEGHYRFNQRSWSQIVEIVSLKTLNLAFVQ